MGNTFSVSRVLLWRGEVGGGIAENPKLAGHSLTCDCILLLVVLILLFVGPAGTPAYRTSALEAVCTLTPVLVLPFISRGALRQTA
jgi:hypothetical protein